MSTEPTGQELTVVNRVSGEVLDPRTAETARLAAFVTDLHGIRQELSEAESVVSDELVSRLDRDACWTAHVDDGETRWEIKAASPTAGTTSYPEDLLEVELQGLVDAATISSDAAAKALNRRVVLELSVPWDADPREIARKVKQALSIEVAGVTVTVERADAKITPVASAIAALRKVPGTSDALDAAKREQPQGKRRVTVKLKGGE